MGQLSAALTSLALVFHFEQLQYCFWVVSIRLCGWPHMESCGDAPEANASAPSPLKVVLASTGQTATTSVDLAIRYMGLKSFHIEEKYIYAHRLMWDLEDHSEFRRAVAGCKIEALTLEPPVDSLPLAMATAPGAKVILTWRDYPSWQISATAVATPEGGKHGRWEKVIYDVSKSFSLIPWGQIYERLSGDTAGYYREGRMFTAPEQVTLLTWLMQRLMGKFGDPDLDRGGERGNYKLGGSEEAYLGHQDEIRRTVPPGQLLEFDPKRHGWAELERFLGRPAPKDRPFPHSRSKASWTNDAMADQRPDVVRRAITMFLIFHVVNFSIVHFMVKAALHLLWKVGLVPSSWLGYTC